MDLQRVYVLYGRANSGKTSTLNALIDLLGKTADRINTVKEIGSVDRLAMFKINGLVVGVVTQGDYSTQVENGLDEIADHCDIIFCATRTGGSTCTHVEDRFGDKLIWIHSPYIDNHKPYEYKNSRLYEKRNEVIAELLLDSIYA